MPVDLLAAALDYTAHGWFVIPLCWPAPEGCGCGRCTDPKNVGKRPLLGAGYQDARADNEQVRQWWTRWPDANIGMLLEPSGLLVIDLDGPEAVEEAKERGLPKTPTVRSGGGWHLYYRRPEGTQPGRKTHGGRSQKIDVLAKGLLTAPPSLHRTGRRYAWVQRHAALPLAEPPAWAVEELAASAPAPWLPGAVAALPAVPERLSRHAEAVLRDGPSADPERYPSRSEAVAAVVWAMIGAGHPPAAIVSALLARAWACEGKVGAERYFEGEVRRALAAGARPHVLEPAPTADAGAAFAQLPTRVQGLFATEGKARARGAVEAVRAGLTVEQVCTVLLAVNGGDLDEARGVARWAESRAREGDGRRAG